MKTLEEWTLDPSTVKLVNLGNKLIGTVIRCTSGTLWVTQEGDPRDHVLHIGDELRIAMPGPIVIQAFTPAIATFGPGTGAPESLEQYLFDRGRRAA